MIGNVQIPSTDALSGATSLLAALSDPKTAQAHIDALREATEDYRKAQFEHQQSQKALDERETAVAALEADAHERDVTTRNAAAGLSNAQKEFSDRVSAWEADRVSREVDLASRVEKVSARETAVSKRESSAEARHQELDARQTSLTQAEAAYADKAARLREFLSA